MALESKTAFQLQHMIAEMAGFHPDNIDVVKLGNDGGFRGVLIGTVGAVSKSKCMPSIATKISIGVLIGSTWAVNAFRSRAPANAIVATCRSPP